MNFAIPLNDRHENKRKWKDKQILGSCLRAEKTEEHKDNGVTKFS